MLRRDSKQLPHVGTLGIVNFVEASESVTNLALLPGFLDPVNLLNSFGTWMLVGLLLVVFIESGLLFPLLPGDSLLFTAGLIAASKSAEVEPFAPLWVLMVTIPIAAILGDQVGYYIGTKGGAKLFKNNDAKLFKKKYLDESHRFFLRHGPAMIFFARFVPIVRTYAPLVAGAAKMPYRVFIVYNVIGGIVWGAGVTLLGYLLGQISFIADNVDIIFLLIVFVSVLPIISEVGKRFLTARKNAGAEGTASDETSAEQTGSASALSGAEHAPTTPIPTAQSAAQTSAPTTPIPMINTDPNNRR
ncbi:VTT domain-containing protein [Rhodococcus sp. NPDC060090]|uniref:VTT domain-containing protein n=1 Tax=Rhodococcus sp. NPDC060090 TaxID=3347056 RepID=UPI00365E2A83